ncbi:MAG: hypothetical protein R3F04_00220 [Lysobacteraceae bacterium]
MSRLLMLFLALLVYAPANAQFELEPQFAVNVTQIVDPVLPGEGLGYAAVGFDGSDYWVARWASSRFTRISQAGAYLDSFDIPDLVGTRSLTWDGTHFWAANNTTVLSRIDPQTRTVVATLAVPAIVRYASYDATADGGAGGFWVGDFSSDLLLIDMAGNVLQTIAADTIGIFARYGVAVDTTGDTAVLWVFYQGGTNAVQLGAIDLPAGTPRTETLDLLAFVPNATSAVAGGLFRTSDLPDGQNLLLALAQGDPDNAIVAVRVFKPSIFAHGFEGETIP